MRTERDRLWSEYYAAVQTGHKVKAQELLKLIQGTPARNNSPGTPVARQARGGGCSRCRRRI